jgi:hypothetical protein
MVRTRLPWRSPATNPKPLRVASVVTNENAAVGVLARANGALPFAHVEYQVASLVTHRQVAQLDTTVGFRQHACHAGVRRHGGPRAPLGRFRLRRGDRNTHIVGRFRFAVV